MFLLQIHCYLKYMKDTFLSQTLTENNGVKINEDVITAKTAKLMQVYRPSIKHFTQLQESCMNIP